MYLRVMRCSIEHVCDTPADGWCQHCQVPSMLHRTYAVMHRDRIIDTIEQTVCGDCYHEHAPG